MQSGDGGRGVAAVSVTSRGVSFFDTFQPANGEGGAGEVQRGGANRTISASHAARERTERAQEGSEGQKDVIAPWGGGAPRPAAAAISPASASSSLSRTSPLGAPSTSAGSPHGLRQRTTRGARGYAGDLGGRSSEYSHALGAAVGARAPRSLVGAGIEALDYLPADSAAYRRWLRAHPSGRLRAFDRWLATFALGCVVGLIAFSLHFVIQSLSKAKARSELAQQPTPALSV